MAFGQAIWPASGPNSLIVKLLGAVLTLKKPLLLRKAFQQLLYEALPCWIALHTY
jgi:hypothetical protein